MISFRPALARFGWIGGGLGSPDVPGEDQKFRLEELSQYVSVQTGPYGGWRITLLPGVEFSNEKANKLQFPDVTTFCNINRIKYWEVYKAEAMTQFSAALREIFAVQTEETGKKVEPAKQELTTITLFPTKDYEEVSAKEFEALGLDQLPSFIKCRRCRNYWEITLAVDKEFPLKKAHELQEHPYIFGNGNIERVKGWAVYSVEGLALLTKALREHFAAQTEEEAKKSPAPPISWTIQVELPKADRRAQQWNQMAQMLAADMLLDETLDPTPQPIFRKPGIKETGK